MREKSKTEMWLGWFCCCRCCVRMRHFSRNREGSEEKIVCDSDGKWRCASNGMRRNQCTHAYSVAQLNRKCIERLVHCTIQFDPLFYGFVVYVVIYFGKDIQKTIHVHSDQKLLLFLLCALYHVRTHALQSLIWVFSLVFVCETHIDDALPVSIRAPIVWVCVVQMKNYTINNR